MPCNATNASGAPCAAKPVRASGFCWWHEPGLMAERDEARRRGGWASSHTARLRKRLPAGVMTGEALLGIVGLAITGVLGGDTEPSVGNAVANLARAYVLVREASAVEDLTRRLEALEQAPTQGWTG